jgi:glycosyltransferase involved in cell wall biosynthesis
MSSKKIVLHITTHLGGGVGSVVTRYLKEAKKSSSFEHRLASLDSINEHAKVKLQELEMVYLDSVSKEYAKLFEQIKTADILFIHWWNHPLMYQFMVQYALSKSRVILWSHISGLYAPSNFTLPLFHYADRVVFTTPISFEAKEVGLLPAKVREKLSVIWSSSGLEHLKDVEHKEHEDFIIGYIGTVDYAKMHKDFLNIVAQVQIPKSRFVVCGGDDEEKIAKEAQHRGLQSIEFMGKVDNVAEYLQSFDIFIYPLSPYHFGTCDQILAEAMAAGVVPVVFDNPMELSMVEHEQTGLIATTKEAFVEAIKLLYEDKIVRKTLCENAKKRALQKFSFEFMFQEWESLLHQSMQIEPTPKCWSGKYSGEKVTGFELFLESTGIYAKEFETLLLDDDYASRQKAFAKIQEELFSMQTWQSNSKGTLKQYRRFFAEDTQLLALENFIDSMQNYNEKDNNEHT